MRNLCFNVALAPYRIDYYNYLVDYCDFDIYFQLKWFKGQLFKTDKLEKECTFTPKYLRTKKVFGNRLMTLGVKQIIQKSNPKYVIVPEFSFLTIQIILIKIIYRYHFKIISQCDDSYTMLVDKGFSRLHNISRKLCMKYMHNIILVDTKALKWYKEKYQKGIWMPIILDEKKFNINQLNEIKSLSKKYINEYNLHEIKTLLFVGRLIKVKNIHRLIEACSILTFKYKLIIIGEGELKIELQNFANQKNVNVSFLGQQNGNSLYAWYYTADVFILPSIIEPFGAVTNEALLFGCNCCISQVAGSSCLINENENGFLIDPISINDMVNKITQAAFLPKNQHRVSKMKYSFTDLMKNLKSEFI